MTLKRVATGVGILASAAAVAVAISQLGLRPVVSMELSAHIVDYNRTKKDMECALCWERCRRTCEANGIKLGECKCPECEQICGF